MVNGCFGSELNKSVFKAQRPGQTATLRLKGVVKGYRSASTMSLVVSTAKNFVSDLTHENQLV